MDLAIGKARASGIGLVWVRNTSDFTAASNYAMQALERGMVGVAMSNGVPLVAPWGGRDPVFNTNPIAVAIPAGRRPPIVIDMAASATSHGKVVHAARDGKLLPGPWLVDEQGRVTAEAAPFITDVLDRNSPQTAAILPLGGQGAARRGAPSTTGMRSGAPPASRRGCPPAAAPRREGGRGLAPAPADRG